jgi:small-conductance mechanosensitive channel
MKMGSHGSAEGSVGLSWLAEVVLWLLLFAMTYLIEISTFQWLPAYHFTAGLCMLRFAQAVEHQITELALNLDIELTTTCFLRRAVFWLSVCIAGVTILSSMGVATEVMVNFLTSISFAIGLASQQMLTDMVAGVMVMIWRPFAVGDLIQIEGTDVRGFVHDVLLTETRVDTEVPPCTP